MISTKEKPATRRKKRGVIILNGKLSDMSMVNTLQLIKMSGKSGVLHLTDQNKRAEITVYKNSIVHASSPDEILFGEFLINAGYLSMENLTKALELQKLTPFPLGRILQEMGFLEENQASMNKLLNRFLRDVVYRIMKWNQGELEFEDVSDEQFTQHFDLSVKLNMDFLILENAQRVDEWRALANDITSLKSVLKINRNCMSDDRTLTIAYDQWQVLSYVNGRRTILRILEKIGDNETHYLSVINEMIRDRRLVEKQAEAMKVIVPARVAAERSSKERHFPGKFEANLLYKQIDGKKNLFELARTLDFELNVVWENLQLLLKSEIVEIAEGRREFQNLSEEM